LALDAAAAGLAARENASWLVELSGEVELAIQAVRGDIRQEFVVQTGE